MLDGQTIAQRIAEHYPEPKTELVYENEMQLAIAVTLSAQTTDKKVNEITLTLFKKYKTWESIKSRCLNPNNVSYPNYGARGIKICDKWLKFSGFDEDMPDPPTNKHSIDRVDNNGDYCKENCRWVTKHEQNRNKRTNRIIEFNGKQQLLTDWAKDLDISVSALIKRLKIIFPPGTAESRFQF
jgi:hypothetical protein